MVYGNNYYRVNYNYTTNRTHPNAQRNMVPRAVLMKTGLKSFNIARTVNTAHPKSIVFSAKPLLCFSKLAQSTVKRPYQSKTVLTNKNFSQKVNTAKVKVNTVRPKAVNTARPNYAVVNAGRDNLENVVKASACWVWRPTKLDSASITLKKHNYIDTRGRSKSLMEDMLPLEEELEEEKSLVKMCDKKNCVLFTDTACFVLSPDFKLPDERQILLKIPRKNNMYSVDMKNIVPKESLTCLVAKATLDELMLWHRRLGHINFKTINKLVKDNLVRARTMLGDSKLPTTFWAEAVNTACNVQNMVIFVKPHNKTLYELFIGRTPVLSFMRPFGCHVSILNTLDNLGKFDEKSDDGFFVGYSLTSKAFRVYNIRTRKLEENLHIRFLEDKPIVLGDGPKWLFDIDSLTKSMNYVPVIAGTNSNDFTGSEVSISEGTTSKETDTSQDYIVMPLWKDSSLFDSPSMNVSHDEPEPSCDAEKKDDEGVSKASGVDDQERPESSTSNINTVGPSINTACANLRIGSLHINTISPTVLTTRSNRPQFVSDIISLRDNVTPKATNADLFGDETEMDMSNLNASYHTRGMIKTANEQGLFSVSYERKPHENLNTCLFFSFLSQEEPKRVTKALSDSARVEAINKKDERGIVIRNKARLVAQGYTQEEGIDYDEVFAPVARIEAIRLFLAYASFMGFMVHQMDVKSAFLYGQIEDEVYVCQPLGFEDPNYPDKVYKVVKTLYGLHQAPRA
ncbi:putative ribonuclease H-like domain-containing protein [Tanacetum coccineum]|uniref:Ribonuclease H-like domain-containing protein n=1 Tax=Tanacetum coccineum TaxID=301880 RepID=A0ABQ5I9W3_9ASTR